MNASATLNTTPTGVNAHLADRLLAAYSLLLILVGTPCNVLCCLIYFQKGNRANSIKTIFGYLAILDTVVLYTFNLNYVVREFNIEYHLTHTSRLNASNGSWEFASNENINFVPVKKNLEEYSLFACRFLSYLAFSILQTSSWVLAFGSLNRYLLISKLTLFEFVCKRSYTVIICLCITCLFFLANTHMLLLNGFRAPTGEVICYRHQRYEAYMVWYQRVHLCFYSALPSAVLMILNTLLMRIIFASKKRLNNHQRTVLLPDVEMTEGRRGTIFLKHFSNAATSKTNKQAQSRSLNRHSRKLTLSLIFITLSYFVLTFPSTVIFSFFRSYIKPARLRRTISTLFTNLSTTTHAIRFFIYFACSIDFRTDFYNLLPFKRPFRIQYTKSKPRELPLQLQQQQPPSHRRGTHDDPMDESVVIHDRTDPA